MAQVLARASLHLGATTVKRILKETGPVPEDVETVLDVVETRHVTAKRAGEVWHVDLTVAPTVASFWVPWLPFALVMIMDHMLVDRSVERLLTEEDHLIQAFGLDRSHETFGEGVHVRCLVRTVSKVSTPAFSTVALNRGENISDVYSARDDVDDE